MSCFALVRVAFLSASNENRRQTFRRAHEAFLLKYIRLPLNSPPLRLLVFCRLQQNQ